LLHGNSVHSYLPQQVSSRDQQFKQECDKRSNERDYGTTEKPEEILLAQPDGKSASKEI